MKEQGPCRDEKCMELSYYSNKTEIEEKASKRNLITRRGKGLMDKTGGLVLLEVRHIGFELSVWWFAFMMLMLITCYIHKVNFSPIKMSV